MPISVSVMTVTEYNELMHKLELTIEAINKLDIRLKKIENAS